MSAQTNANIPRSVKAAVAVFAAAALLAGGGFVAGRGSAVHVTSTERSGAAATPAPAPDRSEDPARRSATSGGLRLVDGVPVGYPHSRSGALSAAANYTAAFGSPAVLTKTGRKGLARAVEPTGVDNEVRRRLAEAPKSTLLAGLDDDRRAGRPMVLQSVPLALKVVGRYDPSTTKVAVYAATYVAGSENTARVGHGTAFVTLIWWRGDWKLRAIVNRPETGPIPAGYAAPPNGWQPGPGGNLVDASQQVRDAMSGGTVPTYVVR